MISGQWAVWAD